MSKRIKWTQEKVIDYINNTNGNMYVSGEYDTCYSKLTLRCSCGNLYQKSFTKFYHSNQSKCPNCGHEVIGNKLRKSQEQFEKEIEKVWGKEFTVLGEYNNNRTPIKVRHNSIMCNFREYDATPYAILGQGKGCQTCYYLNNKGSNNVSWNPNLTDEERIQNRDYLEYQLWRTSVYERDNYTCQKCFEVGVNLNAHHVLNYADYPELRVAIDNGITLCKDCHMEFHTIYGYRNTTEKQLIKYLS